MQWPSIQRKKMNGTAPKDYVIVKVRSSVWVVHKYSIKSYYWVDDHHFLKVKGYEGTDRIPPECLTYLIKEEASRIVGVPSK